MDRETAETVVRNMVAKAIRYEHNTAMEALDVLGLAPDKQQPPAQPHEPKEAPEDEAPEDAGE